MTNQDYDITGEIGPMFHHYSDDNPAAIPMYSFDRPATIVWNAIGARLSAKGWTDAQIKTWLQSKDARWALDFSLGEALTKVATDYANTITRT